VGFLEKKEGIDPRELALPDPLELLSLVKTEKQKQ
jgi:hypothetical protein